MELPSIKVLVASLYSRASSIIISAKELLADWFILNSSIYWIELKTSYESSRWPLENFLMKGCSISYLASGRLDGFICKHCFTKSLNYGDHCEGSFKDCTGLDLIMKMAMKGLICELGTCPYASSIDVIPSDQISVLYVYSLNLIISGLIQYGLPMWVRNLALVCIDEADTPKSASFALPFWSSRMLAALISRWIFFRACK